MTLRPDWVFRTLLVRSHEGRVLDLRCDDRDGWQVDGRHRPGLEEAVDIDLAFSMI